jgi:hypothetical protein
MRYEGDTSNDTILVPARVNSYVWLCSPSPKNWNGNDAVTSSHHNGKVSQQLSRFPNIFVISVSQAPLTSI